MRSLALVNVSNGVHTAKEKHIISIKYAQYVITKMNNGV